MCVFFFFFVRFIYLLESDRAREWGVGRGRAEGERERGSQADSPLNTEPDEGLDLTIPRS